MSAHSPFHFAIPLSPSMPSSLQSNFLSLLQSASFTIHLKTNDLTKNQVLFVKMEDFESFMREAENLKIAKKKICKRTTNARYLESLKQEKYVNFLKGREELDPRGKQLELFSSFTYEGRRKFIDFKEGEGEEEEKKKLLSIFDEQEVLMIGHSLLMKIESKEAGNMSLITYLQEKDYIEEIIPLHNYSQSKNLESIDSIRGYLGEQSAIYFTFLKYMQKWLLLPALIGVLVALFNKIFHESVDDSPFESIYSGFMVLWGACFTVFWQKRQISLGYEWNCFGKAYEKGTERPTHQHFFHEKTDPVTGMKTQYYPTKQRYLKYLESFAISLPMLLMTIVLLVFSLNIRGYVKKEHTILYISWLSSLAEPGAIFDQNTNAAFIPTLLHVIMLFIVNMLYSSLSHWTTSREVHRTVQGFENAMIVKRVIFETFNTFTDLSYIAFVRLDITSLKTELVSIYTADELRRVVTETVIPYIMNKINQRRANLQVKPFRIKKDDDHEELEYYLQEKLVEITYPKYEPFDDYLEIIINFGYITLFASAFPLAPLLIFLFHWMENHSDRYKILHLYRRQIPERCKSIGSWLQVLNIITMLSVLSNLVLFAFSSDKMAEFFPFLFRIYKKHILNPNDENDLLEATPKRGMGQYVVLIVFILEHFFFICIWILRRIVLNQEDWTNIYKKRKEYKMKLKKKWKKEEGSMMMSSNN